MAFPRHRVNAPKGLYGAVQRQPFLYFGLPFMLTIVAGSFALSNITQAKFDYQDSKVATVTQEDTLKMSKQRRKVDLRQEYIRLQGKGEVEFDNERRIPRLPGQADWGELPPTAKS